MKIVSLTAENVKRLVAVEITPQGNMVEITGKNGAGKTSILDSIWWALAGTKSHQSQPIRTGEDEARIQLDLGDVIVRREFKRRKGSEEGDPERITTSIAVENADGSVFRSPQTMIDKMLGTLSFDPLAFSRMDPKEQFATLSKVVGVSFEKEEKANADDYARRTELNRAAKQKQSAADQIVLPDDAPTKKVSVTDLMAEMEAINERNARIGANNQNRAAAQGLIIEQKQRLANLEKQVEDMQRTIKDNEAEFASFGDPQEPEDVGPIAERIKTADTINAVVDRLNAKGALKEEAHEAKTSADKLTQAMDDRRAAMRKKLDAADMPVEGLGLEDGQVTFDGLPLDQASDADKLRVSCGIAMRSNATLRVIRIRDGSLLDDDSLKLLAAMADENDCQIWIERVDMSGKIGFVIEDGQLVKEPDKPTQPLIDDDARTEQDTASGQNTLL